MLNQPMKLGNGLGELHLVCLKCTRESHIPAPTLEEAVEIAKLRGWVADGSRYVCPRCPAVRVKAHDPVGVSIGFGMTHKQGMAMELPV